MKIFRLLLFLILLSTLRNAYPQDSFLFPHPVTKERTSLERFKNDPLAVKATNPVFDEFPDSSLVDFSYLLDPPAGKCGFVIAGEDGHFHFEKNGRRIRFWGVTVASSHIDIPKERIRSAVDAMARAGCNILRLHEIDNRGGEKFNLVRRNIIDEAYPHNNDSRHFDSEYRDRVDYWIHCAREKGIYVYLVIRGYRTFFAGDGVAATEHLERKAAPYGFFNPRLLELQDEYILQWLFEHKNPYTGLPNGLDPAVCMMEIENEDSLFFNPTAWNDFIEPYKTEFQALWNEWLREKYAKTEDLRLAWSVSGDTWSALTPEENLEQGSVKIPNMRMRYPNDIKPDERDDPLSHPLRQRDGVRFAVDVQRKFFRRQRDLIRAQGCPIPLTAVVNSQIIPDTWSVAQELDFIGENAYQDHPNFMAGEEWVGKSFFSNRNYLKETDSNSLGCFLARYKWAGKPLVCREWANCWPNEYRCSANVSIATQALLQDYDAMIYFSFYAWGNQNVCSPFGIQADPAQWGSFGYAAHLFITGGVKPFPHSADIVFTEEDLFTWGHYTDYLHAFAWDCRLQNRYSPGAVQSDSDIRISSGRSGRGVYSGVNNILWDAQFDRWHSLPISQRRHSIYYASGYQEPFIFLSDDFPTTAVIQAGYEPLWIEGDISRGFRDKKRNNIILKSPGSQKVVEAARDLLSNLPQKESPLETAIPDSSSPRSAGEVFRDAEKGRLIVDAPSFKSVSGEIAPGENILFKSLEITSQSPVGCVTALSLDSKPLEESLLFAIKMTTIAKNRGQILRDVKGQNLPANYVLESVGGAPVQTEGRASEKPTVLSSGGELLMEIFMRNGAWEAIFDKSNNVVYLTCDTPNIRFRMGKKAFKDDIPRKLVMRKYYYEYTPDNPVATGNDLVYPGFAKYIRITPDVDRESDN
ncbi:beta-galactosidase [Candidatus Sumerlaeota bacterium]|nr:beta-galactosidase [Candidatus Sumerlaeota bacterium]